MFALELWIWIDKGAERSRVGLIRCKEGANEEGWEGLIRAGRGC